jgi:membrane protein DedA with SNARE-associated domain
VDLEALVSAYGYWAILIGTFLEGETILVIGGFAAHRGWLELPLVMLAAFAGSVLGDQLWYFLGRRHAPRILHKRPQWEAKMAKVTALVHRHQDRIVFFGRFLYGLRTVIPFAVGAAGVSPLRYTLLNAAGAAVWAVAFGCGGYFLGEVLERFLHELEHYEALVLGALLAAGALFWLIRRLRARRRAARLAATAVLLACLPACTYAFDRGRDLTEVVRVQGGVGRGLGATAAAAGILHVGINLPGSMPHEAGIGTVYGDFYFMRSRRPLVRDTEVMAGVHWELLGLEPGDFPSNDYTYRQSHKCWTFLPALFSRVDCAHAADYPESSADEDWLEGPMLWSQAALERNTWAHVHAFDIELGVYVVLVNAKLGISPGEAVDFVAGIVGWDLVAGDDTSAPGEYALLEPEEGTEEVVP